MGSMVMEERRQSERHNLIIYLSAESQGTNELLGRVVDLSNGGLMLISTTSFEPESLHHLRIGFPCAGITQIVEMEVECRWCRPGAEDESYDAGFKFLCPNDELREMISTLIEHVGFTQPQDVTDETGHLSTDIGQTLPIYLIGS